MRNLRSHPTQRRDHYQELTDKIVAALEAGVRRGGGHGTRMPAVDPTAGQRCDRPSLSRRQSLRAQHVTPRLNKRRSALVQLPASGGARMAGAQGREGDARLFLQADRDRGQNR